MNINKIVIYITVFTCLVIIGGPTLYKVIKDNHQKLYIVTQKQIIEAAEKCYYAEKCPTTKITLKELYDNGYLQEDIIDPVTKIIYDESSYVLLTKKDSTFYPA